MTLAIMQPYIFPYIGYFQLIKATDKFVVYDDVNFIKGGWINRNRILLNKKEFLFTVPLKDASSNKFINDTELNEGQYNLWQKKFLSTVTQAYKKAPGYKEVFELIETVLNQNHSSIASLARESIKSVCSYTGVTTRFVDSSVQYENQHLKSQERVIDICKKEGSTRYLNAAGGQNLYFKEDFLAKGVELSFISPRLTAYPQNADVFIPGLSIIDVLMNNDQQKIAELLSNFEILNP